MNGHGRGHPSRRLTPRKQTSFQRQNARIGELFEGAKEELVGREYDAWLDVLLIRVARESAARWSA